MKKILFFVIFLLFSIVSIVFVIRNSDFVLIKLKSVPYFSCAKKTKIKYDGKYVGTTTIIETVNILKYSEPKASQIMKDFAYKDIERNVSDQGEVNRLHELMKDYTANAFEFDLNDDGVNEVIGLPPPLGYYFAPWGAEFFILKKQGDEYVEIDNEMIYTYEDKLVILKEKTNGYHHMQFRRTGSSEPKHLIKFDKKRNCFRFYYYKYLNKK